MNKLHISIGYGTTLEDALKQAVDQFNDVDGNKTFITKDIFSTVAADLVKVTVIIWFMVQVHKHDDDDDHKFIGSINIDPNDPDWRQKLYSNTLGNALQGTQEGSGEAIESNLYSDTESEK